jgi:hypothetical protein
MFYVLVALSILAGGTFIYSIVGVLLDSQVVWEQMNWTPTYPYGENYENPSYRIIRNRHQMARVDCDRAVEAKNYAGAGTYDGMIIGLSSAETILRDSIRENEARVKFSQGVDDSLKTQLDGMTHVDPRGAIGERRDPSPFRYEARIPS